MKKVLIITYYWPPSGGAGVQRWLKFSKYLPEFDIEPIILTVDSKYASYPQTDKSLIKDISPNLTVIKTKSFEPLNILSRLLGKKNVPYGGFTNVNKKSILQIVLRFIRGNFFIPDARVGWNKYAFKKAKEIILKNKIETVITTSPPHSTQLIGLKLKQKLNIRWIADFRDPWTDIYYYNDLLHLNFVKKRDKKREKKVLETADKVISNCESNKNLLLSKISKQTENKFQIITNGFDKEEFIFENKKSKDFIITYSGTISENYAPDIFFKVLSHIKTNFKEINFKLRMLGNVAKDIEKLIDKNKLAEIYEPIGYVNHNELIKHLISSTLLFYIFPKTKNDKGIAGKLFEYLAVRKTIIGIAPKDGDSAKIINECKAGRVFERDEEKVLLKYFSELIDLWKINGHLWIENNEFEKYSRQKLSKKISELIYTNS